MKEYMMQRIEEQLRNEINEELNGKVRNEVLSSYTPACWEVYNKDTGGLTYWSYDMSKNSDSLTSKPCYTIDDVVQMLISL